MQEVYIPILLEVHKQLPVYLVSAGIYFDQNEIDRPEGYRAYQWISCLKGKGEVIIGQKSFILEEGMAMLIYKDKGHYYRRISKEWITSWISFDGFAVMPMLQQMGFVDSGEFKISEDGTKITEKIKALIDEGRGQERLSHISSMSYEFMIELPRYMKQPYRVNIGTTNRLQSVIDYIKLNYHGIITLEDLASIIAVSPQYLCRLFNKIIGKRPLVYVNEVRIQNSKRLMLSTNDSIQDIASAVGFEHSSYFGKWFKKTEGMTPGAFRKSYRGDF